MRHSRWWKLKTCNYIFLLGYNSSIQIFIKACCSRCNHMLALIHHQKPAPLSSFSCRALFFYWDNWFFMTHWWSFPSTCEQAAVVGWRAAIHTARPNLELYWAIPVSRCLQNLIQEPCQYGKQSCFCPSFLAAMKSLMRKS